MTSDAGHGAESEAERVYRRTVDEVAVQQVVAAAEDVVVDAWIEELEKTRRLLLVTVESAWDRESSRCAYEPDDLGRLRHELEAVEEELESVCCGAIERSQEIQDALARLRSAWMAAYGPDSGR